MSVLLILYNLNGAVIFSDSRKTSGVVKLDNTKKVYSNGSIIFGQMGIYTHKNVDFKKTVTEGLLAGKELKEIVNSEYKDTNKTLKDLIPDDEMVTVFYAKKNGEIGVYDIKKTGEIKNLADSKTGYFRNTGTSRKVFDILVDNYLIFHENESIDMLVKKGKYIIENFIKLEENYELMTNIPSIVGGNVQTVYIEFDK